LPSTPVPGSSPPSAPLPPCRLSRAATCRAPAAPGRRGHPAPGPDDLLLQGHHREVQEERRGL
jgi:hypothetical protein